MSSLVEFLPLPRSFVEWVMKKAVSFSSSHPRIAAYLQAGYEGTLTIRDNRTGRDYQVPIVNNAVSAVSFMQIKPDGGDTQRGDTGLKLYDPGFRNTAVTESSITLIDGYEGVIKYRNQSIESLVGKADYEDVTHLLIWGHLPSPTEKAEFKRKLNKATDISDLVAKVISQFPQDALLPLTVITGMATLATTDKNAIPSHVGDNLYCGKLAAADEQIIRSLSAVAVVTSMCYCHFVGIPFTKPDPACSYVENLLLMTGIVDKKTGRPSPKKVSVLQRLSVLYADHEMTCSTAAYLHCSSTLADPLSSSVSGMAAGYGPLHGGAIGTAYKTMRDIGSPSEVPKLIERVKRKEVRLFGYGHRIYRTIDPRATLLMGMLEELIGEGDEMDPVIHIAMEIDRIASTDEYFTSRKLYANADLYGSLVFIALGFDPYACMNMAQILRSPGVLAHWRESMGRIPTIWRPQQLYTGEKKK